MKKSWWKNGPLGVLLATAMIAGCSAQTATQTTQPDSDGTSKSNNTLVISSLIEPDTLDLHKTSWLGNENGLLYEPLLTRDTTGKIVPRLAEKYEISQDGKTWTFTLRKNTRFHSGEPVTAAAVKESFDRMLEISPVKGIAGPIEKVEAADEQTLKIHFSKPFAPFINLSSRRAIPCKYLPSTPATIGGAGSIRCCGMFITSDTASTMMPIFSPSSCKSTKRVSSVWAIGSRPNILRRFTIGKIRPRRSMTPSTYTGDLGKRVMGSGLMISRTKAMDSP
ncbi:ABC transporter substrate-binding protein [Brevibacillus agri BAB-2500]|nr:ABC transporter substrate-binding protein [Brevibacillus agri BAB-2500]